MHAVFLLLCVVPGFWSWLWEPDEIYPGRTGYPNQALLLIAAMFVVPIVGYYWLVWKARRRR